MPQRAAGLDVGTNSFLLLILARDEAGRESVLLDRSDITRLGQGVDRARALAPEAVARALVTLGEYAALCRDHGVQACRAVGTSALRDARDRDAFLAQVRARCGFEIEVISGEREAELTYAAVAHDRADDDRPLLLLDIGGGSTELAVGRAGRLRSRLSLDIGAVRLLDRAGPLADPPTPDDLARLRAAAAEHLAAWQPLAGEVVGTGGTITTLAAVQHGLVAYDAALVESTRFTPAAVDALVARLAALPLAQRRVVPGLPPARADVIIPGAILLAAALRALDQQEIGVSAGGLRFALARAALAGLGA
jgi:exopolyphosphatase/guanosine-5'-triphosphate,3'-diphosphate pyrophosphatase